MPVAVVLWMCSGVLGEPMAALSCLQQLHDGGDAHSIPRANLASELQKEFLFWEKRGWEEPEFEWRSSLGPSRVLELGPTS